MTLLLGLLITFVAFMVFISILLLFIGPILLLQPTKRTEEYYRKLTTILHPKDLAITHEDISLTTTEGIPLSCWLLRQPAKARGTIIYLHGVSECKIVGLPMAKVLFDEGYNVFLYDSRRHGDSGGKYCTYGYYEKHDVSSVIDYLLPRSDLDVGQIGLFGSSMGAAIAVQAASIDNRILAVVAESGFATLRAVFDDYQKRIIKLPWHYLRNIVIKRSEHLAHFRANSVSPREAVENVHIPIFILHGTADDLIKYTYSVQLFESTGEPKELWLIDGARHDNMAEIGGEEYTRRLVDFFNRSLDRKPVADF